MKNFINKEALERLILANADANGGILIEPEFYQVSRLATSRAVRLENCTEENKQNATIETNE